MTVYKLDLETPSGWRVVEVRLPARGKTIADVVFKREHPRAKTGTMEMAWALFDVESGWLSMDIDVGISHEALVTLITDALVEKAEGEHQWITDLVRATRPTGCA